MCPKRPCFFFDGDIRNRFSILRKSFKENQIVEDFLQLKSLFDYEIHEVKRTGNQLNNSFSEDLRINAASIYTQKATENFHGIFEIYKYATGEKI